MADNVCVASVLYVPYHCKMYMAVKGHGAYMLRDIEPQDEPNYDARRIHELRERLPLETGLTRDSASQCRVRTRRPRHSAA